VTGRLRRAVAALPFVVVVVTCVLAIGSPLLGTTHLFAGDIVLSHPPWSEEFVENREGTAPQSDFVDGSIGVQRSARERLFSGDFPEWDPLVATGGPRLVTPSGGVYSPIALPALAVPDTYAPALVKLLELLASAGGMFLLCRTVGLTRLAALTGGTVYAFSGFQVMWSTWSQPLTGALIPWVFWAAERLVRRRRVVDVVPLALAVAAMAVAGFPAVVAYCLYALAGYLVLRAAVVAGQGLFEDRGNAAGNRWAALRTWPGEQLRSGLLVGVGIGLGAALVAAVMLPFYSGLADDVLPQRAGFGAVPAPAKLLVTMAFPHAFGVLGDMLWTGPLNEIEGVGFVGCAALVLALFGVVSTGLRTERARLVHPVLVVLVVVTTATYLGGPVLELVTELPGIGTSPVGRMRSVIGFCVAVLAAVGAHHAAELVGSRVWIARAFTAVGAGIAGVVVVTKVRELGAIHGIVDRITPWMWGGVASGALAVLVVLLGRRLPRPAGAWILLLLVAGEALAFVTPYFPRIDPDTSMPVTAAHRFLQEAQGPQGRLAAHETTMLPGTTRFYGLDSLSGHTFHAPTLKELVQAFDPGAFKRSRTYSMLDLSSLDQVSSPVLDRAAVEHAVLPVSAPVFGRRLPPVPLRSEGEALVAAVPDGGLRGVDVEVRSAVVFPDPADEMDLVVEVVESGRVVARAERRYQTAVPAGTNSVPIAGEDLAADPSRTITVRLQRPIDGTGEPRAADLPADRLVPVVADDDGVELVHVSGVAVWRRATALPRFRWATDAIVENDPERRLALLSSRDLSPGTVVLSAGTDGAGGPGRVVELDREDPDRFGVVVESTDGGWLVVADAMQRGWSASIDGEPASLVEADHAFVAVRVPPGVAEVTFDYEAPRARLGLLVSLGAAGVLVGIASWWALRRRRAGPSGGGDLQGAAA
jgi:hypothetical protein